MLLVQIDPRGLKLFQALLDGEANIFRRSFRLALDVRMLEAELGREKHLVAPSLQARPDKDLGIAAAVVFRRIEEIDACRHRSIDHGMGASLVHATAESIAPESHQRDRLSLRAADNSLIHISPIRLF